MGYELTQEKDFSEATAQKIDDEVRRLVFDAEALANQTLEKHRPALEKLSAALLDQETLEKEAVDALVRDAENAG